MLFGSKSRSVPSVSASLVAALAMLFQPVLALEPVYVAGTVFAGAEGAPLIGARVHLQRVDTDEGFLSGTTGADGAFIVADVPVATYRAAVEYDGGLYVVETPVLVSGDEANRVDLQIPRLATAVVPAPGSGQAGFWSSQGAVTLVVAGSALSVGALFRGRGRPHCGNAAEQAQSHQNSNCPFGEEASPFEPGRNNRGRPFRN